MDKDLTGLALNGITTIGAVLILVVCITIMAPFILLARIIKGKV